MRHVCLSAVVVALLVIAGPDASALGITRAVNNTYIGQSLNFAAFVRLDGDETLLRECVFADVMVGEQKLPAGQLRVTLEPTADPAERMVRVTSNVIVDEPIVTVNVSVGCNGRLARSFVEFVDPPALNLATSRPAEPLPPQRVPPQVAPAVEVAAAPVAAPSAAPAPPPASPGLESPAAPVRSEAAPPSRARVAAAAQPVRVPRAGEAAATRPRAQAPVAARRAAPGPRLKLDAPAVAPVRVARAQAAPATPTAAAVPDAAASAVVAPSAAPSAAPTAATAASAVDAALTLATEQQQRIAALEDSLRRLRVEAQNTLGTVATLEARLQEADAARYRNPVVVGLATLAAVLFGLLALMWWRQRGARSEPGWWTPAPAQPVARPAAPAPAADSGPPSVPAPSGPPLLRDSELPMAVTARHEPLTTEVIARRELSVEELIDLEQQADFFIVLGQDEAAIDLLMGHVRSTGGISPLPYLKLLEIYGRRGERDAWERIRERFNRRFNAYAPEWGVDLQTGRGLEQYPEVISELQAQWGAPLMAMQTMDALIFRRDESAPTFELPAYRELLFVYAIARDLTQGPDTAPADLPLPPSSQYVPLAPEPESLPLLTVVPEAYKPTDVRPFPVDIDLSDSPSAFGGLSDPSRRRG